MLAKVGLGCGVLVLLGIAASVLLVGSCFHEVGKLTREFHILNRHPAKPAAMHVAETLPGWSTARQDDDAGRITLTRKEDGAEFTCTYEELATGDAELPDHQGHPVKLAVPVANTTPGQSPDWIVLPPGCSNLRLLGPPDLHLAAAESDMDHPQLQSAIESAAAKLGLQRSSRIQTEQNGSYNCATEFSGASRHLTVIVWNPAGKPPRLLIHDRGPAR